MISQDSIFYSTSQSVTTPVTKNKFYRVSESILSKLDQSLYPIDLFNSNPLPLRGTKHSAGYDFYLPYDIIIPANSSVIIYTGVGCEVNDNQYLQIHIRSSMGIKKGLYLLNSTPIIDSDYSHNPDNDGHILIALGNRTNENATLKAGDRICQGIFTPYYITSDDNVTTERVGGIGSTG